MHRGFKVFDADAHVVEPRLSDLLRLRRLEAPLNEVPTIEFFNVFESHFGAGGYCSDFDVLPVSQFVK